MRIFDLSVIQIQLKDLFETDSHLYIILELVKGGELFERQALPLLKVCGYLATYTKGKNNQYRARNKVPNVPDHADRQSGLFADQIKIWPIRSIDLPSFIEKILYMAVNAHLNRKFISNSSLNLRHL